MSTKISEMVSITSVNPDGSLTVVQNGQNFKISQSDYIAGLGVTGTIVQEGPATATPVLDKAGTVNNIRNLENGSGVKASVSAQNGITLEHNFIPGTTGTPVLIDETTLTPTILNIVAGTGISVARNNGAIQVALSATPTSNNTVIVNEISDFPAAVTGVITLVAGTDYFLTNDMTTANRFDISAGNVVVRASDPSIVTLEYTGTGDMFTSVSGGSIRLRNIAFNCPNGRCWNLSDSAGLSTFLIDNVQIVSCDKIGLITGTGVGFGPVQFTSFICISATTDGMEFAGVMTISARFVGCIGVMLAGSMFNLGTAVFSGITIDSCVAILVGAGSFFLSGAAASANIASDGIGEAISNRTSGLGTPLSSITPDDDLWQFALNDDIRDSRTDGLLSMQGNATATVIAASSTDGSNAVLVAGTWVVASTSQMTGSTAGRLTLSAHKPYRLPIDSSITVEPASGGTIQISSYVAVNGVVDVNSRRTASASAGTPVSIGVHWQYTFDVNDYVEVFVENNSSTVNLLASSAIHRVN